MKHIKTVIIILLLASNTYFIGAYQKQRSHAQEAHRIAEESQAQAHRASEVARMAQEEAQHQANKAVMAQLESEDRVEELESKIAELERK